MKVLYLFNKVLGDSVKNVKSGKGHDSWLFGMLRLSKYDIDAGFLEIEMFMPTVIASFLRKYILTMHYAHIPLFPLFFRYDIVFTSTAYGCLFLKALFGIKKFKWIILDFNILGAIQEGKTLKQKFFTWSITRGADGIVAISQAEADALKKRFPKFIDKIIFLHEPTDTNFFSQKSYMAEKNQIISVGNYARDFDTIIEAVRGLGVELILATKLISPQKAQLLPAYVKVAHLNHQDIVRAYNESKMAIVSLKTKDSYYDSVGTLSLGESMSMGKATIVTHTKNMESYIEDGINGVFIGRENITEMRKAICYLLNNDNKRNSIGIKAREFALNNLDPELFAEKLAFFLKNVVQLPT